jgi:hypothetical protein
MRYVNSGRWMNYRYVDGELGLDGHRYFLLLAITSAVTSLGNPRPSPELLTSARER